MVTSNLPLRNTDGPQLKIWIPHLQHPIQADNTPSPPQPPPRSSWFLPLLSLTHNGPSCQSDQALLTPCLLTLISLWLGVNSWLEHRWGGTLQTTFDPRQPLRLGSGPIGGSAASLVAMETGPAEAQMAQQGVEWVERERQQTMEDGANKWERERERKGKCS